MNRIDMKRILILLLCLGVLGVLGVASGCAAPQTALDSSVDTRRPARAGRPNWL
ncbi:hypothetical protein Y599_5189 [Burkholderia pseudomallei MSHR3458]|nr:hypothetical protein Y044_5581 [Burkholderia pseudomallei MSHR2243]AIV69206.1 putative lipoprotein [Burkholderia pseudomallei MSHR62]KGU69545.1 putative lipoprotein [Burkholderia pseudomallei MSHR465J]KGW73665.1 hypothetical protein Y599_5189 [Burkholderia pseudomallei MSHR3458]